MVVTSSYHKRSKSDLSRKRVNAARLDNTFNVSPLPKLDMEQLKGCGEANNKKLQSNEVQSSLKKEIQHLQKQLSEQFFIRNELEKASSHGTSLRNPSGEIIMNKPAEDLIKEISDLELEVGYLEKYLLSLYRKTFQIEDSSLTQLISKPKENSATCQSIFSKVPQNVSTSKKRSAFNSISFRTIDENENPPKECNDVLGELDDSCIHRSHSSLSQRSFRTPPTFEPAAKTVDSYHSLPLSMLKCAKEDFSRVSLADHLGSSVVEYVSKTPNWLSEEMIKCISAIYCQLADPPLFNNCYPSSPISFSSSASGSSPLRTSGIWSPQAEGKSSFNSWLNNPFQYEGLKDFRGSYFPMVEIKGIHRDNETLRGVEQMIKKFRSLVSWLEEVDPRKLKDEEKLAFWINIHNALVMHTFLVYGIPQGTSKRISLILKGAYNIGGHLVSVDNIQTTILGCRLPRPGQWLQSLFFPKAKLKAGDVRKAYAIKQLQPLIQFALSSGNHSDPMVRIYTPKCLFQELEMAKEEYIHNNFRIHKDQKILLPKIVDLYAKSSSLSPVGLMDIIDHSMPECFRESIPSLQKGRCLKKIEWVPHNFTFRYLLSSDLAK